MKKIQEKRQKRQKITAEVFTPPKLANEMLNKLPSEVWSENKTFLDPAAGNGEFLIWVFLRKVQKKHSTLAALQSIYGVEIMLDNVQECRIRLLKLSSWCGEITLDHISVVLTNIVCHDALTYDFEFNQIPHRKTCEAYWAIVQEKLF